MSVYESGHEGINVDLGVGVAISLNAGLTGEVLTKISGADYDWAWSDPGALPIDYTFDTVSINNWLGLVRTVDADTGTIKVATSVWQHNYTDATELDAVINMFLGIGAGNYTALAGAINNIVIGNAAGTTLTTGNNNILIGTGIEPTSGATSNELNIGDVILGNLATGLITVDSLATGNVNVGGTLDVTGLTTLANAIVGGTLDVIGLTTVDSLATGNVNIGGTLDVTGLTSMGNVDVGGTLDVTGLVTVDALATGNLNVGGTLDVTGLTTLANTTVDGTFDVTGQTTLTALTAQNHAELADVNTQDLSVTGAFTVNTKHLKVLDTGLVGVGTSSPQFALHVLSTTSGQPTVTIQNSAVPVAAAGQLRFFKWSTLALTESITGYLDWYGMVTGSNDGIYGRIHNTIKTVGDGIQEGELIFSVPVGGSLTEMLSLDGSTTVPLTTVTGDLTVTGNLAADVAYYSESPWEPVLLIENANSEITGGGLRFKKTSDSPEEGDEIGNIYFTAYDNAVSPALVDYVRVFATSRATAAGLENGRFIIEPMFFGTPRSAIDIDFNDFQPEITINEDGVDIDFRVESDTDNHALFVDGETGVVTITKLAIGSYINLPETESGDVGTIKFDDIVMFHTHADPGASVKNVWIGPNAGNYTSGSAALGNIGIGSNAHKGLTTGSSNIVMGLNAGYAAATSINCVLLGSTAGYNVRATGVLGIGSSSCRDITTGSYNVGVGFSSCRYMKEGPYNVGIGYFAGSGSSGNLTGGSYNTSVGANSGLGLEDGAINNILIGSSAGKLITTGTFNLMIGTNTEPPLPTDSYKLNIADMIFGDITNKNIGIGREASEYKLSLTEPGSDAVYLQCANSTTDYGTDKGVVFGYNADEKVLLWNFFNSEILVGTNGAEVCRFNPGGRVDLNNTVNVNMPGHGITIKQGSGEDGDEVFALKTPTLNHGITNYSETDTFGMMMQTQPTFGGLFIKGFSESRHALSLAGYATTTDVGKDSTAIGTITMYPNYKLGDTGGSFPANSNVFAIRPYVSTVYVIDSEGDSWQAGDLQTESGKLIIKETTTPTAQAGYGKIYTKSDNLLYFQDGAGVEHQITMS